MQYICPSCSFSLNGIPEPPFCPFCGFQYAEAKKAKDFYAEAKKLALKKAGKRLVTKAYKKAAECGSVEGSYQFANALEKGIGIKKNLSDALYYYHFAAGRGNADAAYAMGRLSSNENSNEEEKQLSAFWYTVSAELLSVPGSRMAAKTASDPTFYLSYSALHGDKDAALEMAEYLAKEDDRTLYPLIKGFLSIARHNFRYYKLLSKVFFSDSEDAYIPEKDHGEDYYNIGSLAEKHNEFFLALYFYRKAYERDYAVAATRIGELYRNGIVLPQDYSNAKKWFLRAADKGDKEATTYIGEFLIYGNGVVKDEKKGLTLLEKCIKEGSARAEYLCGEMYLEGKIVERDINKALELLSSASNKGFRLAIDKKLAINETVSELYNDAVSCKKAGKYEEAFQKFRLASEMGHGPALCNLGYCYQNGTGCKRDYHKAVSLYRQAILGGSQIAKFNLGICYLNNQGVNFNAAQAEELLLGSGKPEATQLIKSMKARKAKKVSRSLYAKACELFHKKKYADSLRTYIMASDAGEKAAFACIGFFYEFGIGLEDNMDLAREWYKKSGLSISEIGRLKRGILHQTHIGTV